jgi:hypothetical protein
MEHNTYSGANSRLSVKELFFYGSGIFINVLSQLSPVQIVNQVNICKVKPSLYRSCRPLVL